MFRLPARPRSRAVFTAGLVLGQVTVWTSLREASAAEGISPQSTRPNTDDRVSWAFDAEGTWNEGGVENLWAQYHSQPPGETADTGVIKQPYFLVDDATEEKADEQADKSSEPLDAAGSSAEQRTG